MSQITLSSASWKRQPEYMRGSRWAVLLLTLAVPLGSALAAASGSTSSATALPAALPAASALPSDEELERLGAVVGKIIIDNQDIFDLKDAREDKALFRVANRWHVETRSRVVDSYLLFKSGEPYSRRLLDESARLLRSLRFLYDARVEPLRFADGRVDVQVTTRDVWSLNPGISFGRKGGKNTSGLEIEELNFLGTGNAIALSHKSEVDRDINRLDFINVHLSGSKANLHVGLQSNSDGDAWSLGLERPFYALDTRWAAGGRAEAGDRVDPLYLRGDLTEEFGEHYRFAELNGGWSSGLRDGWVRRWSAGFTFDDHRFSQLPGRPVEVLPLDRKLVYPWVGFEAIEDAFETLKNHDQIARTEDFFLGTRWRARIGYATTGLGADRNALIYSASAERGIGLSAESTWLLASHLDGRYEDGQVANLLLDAGLRYYRQQSERRLLFATVEGQFGHHLDREQQVLLGGDNGLRGYPLRYLGGDSRARFSIEQRYFTDWYPFRLFRVGAAVFFDAGRTFGNDTFGAPNPGLMKDIGLGLRLGNSRAALGNIIHVDLAFPLDGDDRIKNVQFVIEAQHGF